MAHPKLIQPSQWLVFRWRLDQVAAVALTPLGIPIAVTMGAIVRLTEGAPTTVTLDRVGHRRQPLRMTKIRSMRNAQPGDQPVAFGADDRITRIGQWLRRSHLDEVPQLIHVIRGEMALLGPRPETPSVVDDSMAWDNVLSARPGMAGPTQVIIREWENALAPGSLDEYRLRILPVKLAIDAWYVRTATPILDVQILAALLRLSTRGGTQTRLHRRVRAAVPELAALEAGSPLGGPPATTPYPIGSSIPTTGAT